MLKTGLIKYLVILSLLLPAAAFPDSQEIKEYKVIRGDTLWSISKKELNDPFLWPKVWKENQGISNPDRLYPGQIVRIPLYLLEKETREEEVAPKPEVRHETPKEKTAVKPESAPVMRPLVNRDLLMASGYMSDTIPRAGTVGDSPSGRTLFGDNDIVYVTVDHPAQVGDRFYIIKPTGPVRHPVNGNKIGYVINIMGVAEVTKIKDGETFAKITKCFGDINTGDLLDPYYEIKPPMTDGNFRKPDFNGMVVAASARGTFLSKLDVIYIDRGCQDGIGVGDMFRTLAVDSHAVPTGVIQVISCRDHTATALIEDNSAPVMPGNIFAQLD